MKTQNLGAISPSWPFFSRVYSNSVVAKKMTKWLGKKSRVRCDTLERMHVQREIWKYRQACGGRMEGKKGDSASMWHLHILQRASHGPEQYYF